MLGCSLIRPCFFLERWVFFDLSAWIIFDLLRKKTLLDLSGKKPKVEIPLWESISSLYGKHRVENTSYKTPGWQLGPPLLAVPNLTSPNPLDIPRIRKPSSWIIAIRQSRQDDELSEFFSPFRMDGQILYGIWFFPLKRVILVAS